MKKILIVPVALLIFYSCNNNASNTTTTDTTVLVDTNANPQLPDTIMNYSFSDQDKKFINELAMGNNAEIAAGRMALEKSSDSALKNFANMMIDDHSGIQNELKQTTGTAADSAMAITPPAPVKLTGSTGKSFDKAYAATMVADHKKVVSLFEKQIAEGSNEGLKAFARKHLDHIKMHLEAAKKL